MKNCHKNLLIARQQLGFTLIELTIAIALAALVGSAITMSIYQVYGMKNSTLARVTAQNQVAFAAKWITQDAQQAQNIVTSGLASGLPVQLKWRDWDTGLLTTITYSIDSDNNLVRQQNFSGTNTEIIVASYISSDSSETNCSYSTTDNLFVFNITANVTGPKTSSATALVTVIPKSARVGTN